MDLTKLQVRYATTAIQYDMDPGYSLIHTVEKAWLIDCDTGLYVNNATVTLNNTTKCNVTTLVAGYGYVSESGTKTRCEPLVNNRSADSGLGTSRQQEPSIVLCGSTIVVGFNDAGYPGPPNRNTGYARSTDGGTSFTDLGTLDSGSEGHGSDPSLACENPSGTYPNGVIYHVTNPGSDTTKIHFFRSTDGGSTFPYHNYSAPGFISGDSLDKPWITVDNYSGTGQNYIYQVFINNQPADPTRGGAYFSRSIDRGVNWDAGFRFTTSGTAPDQHVPVVTVGPDHTIYACIYRQQAKRIMGFKSTNQGISWTQFYDPEPSLVSPGGFTSFNYFLNIGFNTGAGGVVRNICGPQAVVNPLNAHIYIVYPDRPSATSTDQSDIYFRKSTDGGTTWTARDRVNDDSTTNDQWSPTIALKPNGTQLFIGFYDRRGNSTNSQAHAFGTIWDINSSTGNFTKKPNFQVSASNFLPGDIEGDYNTATADNSYFYYTWGDNRNHLNDTAPPLEENVRFTKIPSP